METGTLPVPRHRIGTCVPGELRAGPFHHTSGAPASCAAFRVNLSSSSALSGLRATCAPAQRQLSLGRPDSAHHRAHLSPSQKTPSKIHKTNQKPSHPPPNQSINQTKKNPKKNPPNQNISASQSADEFSHHRESRENGLSTRRRLNYFTSEIN